MTFLPTALVSQIRLKRMYYLLFDILCIESVWTDTDTARQLDVERIVCWDLSVCLCVIQPISQLYRRPLWQRALLYAVNKLYS